MVSLFVAATLADKIKVGRLACSIEGEGANIFHADKKLGCRYTSVRGKTELYTGKIEEFGINLGDAKTCIDFWPPDFAGAGPPGSGQAFL